MNEKNLVICDSEIPYATCLAENILEKEELDVQVQMCTSRESLLEFAKDHSIHTLLIDENFYCAEEVTAEQVIYLTREKESHISKGKRCLFKYQHVDKLLADVFAHTNLFQKRGNEEAAIIGIYTPMKEPRQSEFAISLGQALAKDMKTLYLNMQTYSGEELFTTSLEAPGLEDLFYFVKQGEEDFSLRFAAMVQENLRLEYLMPFVHGRDLHDVKNIEWEQLFSLLVKETSYVKILIDFSDGVDDVFFMLLQCDRIYMPVKRDDVSIRIIEKFEKDLYAMGLSFLSERIKKIEISNEMEEDVIALAREEWL